MNITAVIVTKGDVDINPILPSLDPFDEVLIWDNSLRFDRKVYGRFEAAQEAMNDIIYVQDDDVVTDAALICKHYQPGVVTANVPPERRLFYSDGITLIGWGAVFDRRLTGVFRKYLQRWPMDDLFLRECDRIFTALNTCRNIDVPFEHLPHAYGDDRMGQEKRHLRDLQVIRDRLTQICPHR